MISGNKKLLQPRRIRLEASTACQLKCRSCPTASEELGKYLGVGLLKFGDFKHIIDNNPWVSEIELSNWGEIFLNNELIDIIKYAYKQNVALHARNGANLNTVNMDMLEALVRYKFRTITCSIDGACQDTYSIYRVNGNFQQVIENIKTINKFKSQYNSQYPSLSWQFIAFGHNEQEISKARKMAMDLNMAFKLKLSWEDLYTGSFSPIKNAALVRRETGLGVASRGEFKEKYGKEYVLKDCCSQLWTNPQLNYDGRLLGCSINYRDDYGNAFKAGLTECLNDDKIQYAREMLMGKQESKTGIPCTHCKFYKIMKDNNDWLTNEDVKGVYTPKRALILLENKLLGSRLTNQLAKLLGPVKNRLEKSSSLLKERLYKSAQLANKADSSHQLKSRIYPLQIPLPPDELADWKSYPIFKGLTRGLLTLSCHASVLKQNHCPHPPHKHNEEELLLLLSGEVNLILPKGQSLNEDRQCRMKPGQIVYYPANFAHTLKTTSEVPANYLMFKWHAGSRKSDPELIFRLFNTFDTAEIYSVKNGFCPSLVFEGSTAYIQKLQCHTSILSSKAGYKPHKDDYDVAIIILEGEVETLGKRVGPHGLVFYAAGEPHGIRNPGNTIAKYIVFEFHN